jgi:hypothetical protein
MRYPRRNGNGKIEQIRRPGRQTPQIQIEKPNFRMDPKPMNKLILCLTLCSLACVSSLRADDTKPKTTSDKTKDKAPCVAKTDTASCCDASCCKAPSRQVAMSPKGAEVFGKLARRG